MMFTMTTGLQLLKGLVKIVMRLPPYLQYRWRREVGTIRKRTGDNPAIELGPESYDRDLRCRRVLLTTTISQPGFVTTISLHCDVVTIVTHKPRAGAPVMPRRFAFRVNTLQVGVGYRGGSSGGRLRGEGEGRGREGVGSKCSNTLLRWGWGRLSRHRHSK